ncbi:MAG: Uma2 family endonuclease [Thermomicrobiales bacterium]
MSAVHPGYTKRDLDALRVRQDLRYELIDGEVFVTPAPGTSHQLAIGRLHVVLYGSIAEGGRGVVLLAPCDVVLDDETVVQPDLLAVLNDRAGIIGEAGITGAPSLVVEIISPTSRRTDMVVKRGRYARAGIPEYWLVDPEALVLVRHHEPGDDDYRQATVFGRAETMESATIAGLSVDLSTIFSGMTPR